MTTPNLSFWLERDRSKEVGMNRLPRLTMGIARIRVMLIRHYRTFLTFARGTLSLKRLPHLLVPSVVATHNRVGRNATLGGICR